MNYGRPNNPQGWAPQPNNMPQQSAPQGYPPQQTGYQGYAPQQTGYQAMPQGYPPQQGYRQSMPQGYPPQQGYPQSAPQGYPPQQGYQQNAPQGYPPQPNYQQALQGYPQQTGYQPMPVRPPMQQGYQQAAPQGYPPRQQPGYQAAPQGFQPGYAPQQNMGYQRQMGYPPQQNYQGMPQPAPRPPRKPLRLDQLVMIVLCGLLPVLFVLALVFGSAPVLKWIFIGLSVLTVAVLWIKPVIASNLRLMFSLVYGALAVVALVGALTGSPADAKSPAQPNQPAAQTQQQPAADDAAAVQPGGVWTTPYNPYLMQETPVPDGLTSEAVERMESFFYFWSVNNQENMLDLCAPSWKRSVEKPATALFSLLANRIPVDYTAERITGTDNDTTRTVTVVATIDRQNGRDPVKYRFSVLMLKENDTWYVDPRSLQTNEAATDTPDPNATPTPSPTPQATPIDPNVVLYYNPNGGSLYHLDAYCISAHKNYLPFKGQFTYGQLMEAEFAQLDPCNVCNAPLRPDY